VAEIAPFRGILYSSNRNAASDVLAPPYDVIDEEGRKQLENKHPKNCVRLILPQGENRYELAAETLKSWMADGTLVQDAKPALYRYHQVFTSKELDGREVTRKGFIAAVRLHRFDERVILPHERTLRGPKLDRLQLMRATGAHFSQIFTLYDDPKRAVDALFEGAEKKTPDIDGVTEDGTRHRLWRVDDATVISQVQSLLRDRQLYIADGHHRYETMLTLREELLAKQSGADGQSQAQYGTLFLSNMADPGLVVLPTHRLVHSMAAFSPQNLLRKAEEHFSLREIPGIAEDAPEVRRVLHDAGKQAPSILAVFPGSDRVTLMSLRNGFDPEKAGMKGSKAVTNLDVTILHDLILERILKIDRAAQEAQTNLTYYKDTQKGLSAVASGEAQVGFFMNATLVDQVRAVSDAGEIMPQKSTFFYPKIASGIVMRSIDPGKKVSE
jgi:uncharacterized protein (DUF1015 family)